MNRHVSNPQGEARGLALIVAGGQSIESIREDIRLSEKDRASLSRFIDRKTLSKLARFRAAVLREFDRIVENNEIPPARPKPAETLRQRMHRERKERYSECRRLSHLGLTAKEIADRMGCTTQQVRYSLSLLAEPQ